MSQVCEHIIYYNQISCSFCAYPSGRTAGTGDIPAAIIDMNKVDVNGYPMLIWIADCSSATFPGTQQIYDATVSMRNWTHRTTYWRYHIDEPDPQPYRERK